MTTVFVILGLVVGFFLGFFVWSSFLGTLFATIPVKLKAKRLGLIKSVNPLRITAQFLISVIIIGAMYTYAPIMFYSSLIGLFKMLFDIQALRREAVENLTVEYEGVDISKMA